MLLTTSWTWLVFGGALGAILGSFLNVCVYRIPRGVSVVFPPSACPHCGGRIRPYDNVPVLAWLWLRGRCRDCRAPFSVRYPAVEALTAGLFLFFFWRYGLGWELLSGLVFGTAMILITLIDYDARIIPDAITLPGTGAGVLLALVTPISLVDAVLGAAMGFLLLLGIAWGYRKLTGVDGLGGGDIKLAAMLGAFLGWQGFFLTLFLASLLGTLVGLVLILRKRGGRRTALPFGTFLAPTALAVFIWGPRIISWYAGLIRP